MIRRAINTKITDDLRAQLQAAADGAGRTLSREIEERLAASFSATTDNGSPLHATIRTILREELEADRKAKALPWSSWMSGRPSQQTIDHDVMQRLQRGQTVTVDEAVRAQGNNLADMGDGYLGLYRDARPL